MEPQLMSCRVEAWLAPPEYTTHLPGCMSCRGTTPICDGNQCRECKEDSECVSIDQSTLLQYSVPLLMVLDTPICLHDGSCDQCLSSRECKDLNNPICYEGRYLVVTLLQSLPDIRWSTQLRSVRTWNWMRPERLKLCNMLRRKVHLMSTVIPH